MKNDSLRTLQLFCPKRNRWKKHQIFEKWENFKKRPSCKGYSPCKGYSLCKMLSLGQKLKMLKTCQKRFSKNVRVVLCKKPLQKTPIIREMRKCWKSAILQKLYSPCKGYSLGKMLSLGQKSKMPKTCKKRFFKNVAVVLCKKPLEKTPNIREIREFKKTTILQRL